MKIRRYLFLVVAFVVLAALAPGELNAAPRANVAGAFDYKIEPSVRAALAQGGSKRILVILAQQADLSGADKLNTKAEKGRYVFEQLRAVANRTQPVIRARLDRLGLKYSAHYLVNMFEVDSATLPAAQEIASLKGVGQITGDEDIPMGRPVSRGPLAPQTNAANGIEWNIQKINAPQVWAQGFTGKGIVYGIADTGVQWDHPALKSHYRGWNNQTGKATHSYNWWDAIHNSVGGNGPNPCGYNNVAPCDDHGHGTHALGIGIGGDSSNKIGVAPGAKWIGCRNMDQGTGRASRYIECFEFFLAPWDKNGKNPNPNKAPDVVSNSWGCPLGPPPGGERCSADSILTATHALRAAGIFVVAAAGNDGNGCHSVDAPPANYNAATTVGATDSGDVLVSFSSRGPVKIDGSNRLKPDLSAPGEDVRSAYPHNTYVAMSGTSMAAPHVAGAVALLWNARPALRGNVGATEKALFNSANRNITLPGGDPHPNCGGTGVSVIPNNLFGYGRLDVLAALNSVAP